MVKSSYARTVPPLKLHEVRRIAVAVAVALALAVLFVVVVQPWWSGRPFGGRLSDRDNRVSIVVSHGWIDTTPKEAGQVVTKDESGDDIKPRQLPDLAAITWDSATDVPGQQDIRIAVRSAAGRSLAQMHDDQVEALCADELWCQRPRGIKHITVDDQPALAEFLTSDDSAPTLWAVTVVRGDTVVWFTGTSADLRDAVDGGQFVQPLRTLHIKT